MNKRRDQELDQTVNKVIDLLSTKEYDEALSLLLDNNKRYPRHDKTVGLLIELYYRTNGYDSALNYYARYLEIAQHDYYRGSDGRVQYFAGKTYEKLGDKEKAITAYGLGGNYWAYSDNLYSVKAQLRYCELSKNEHNLEYFKDTFPKYQIRAFYLVAKLIEEKCPTGNNDDYHLDRALNILNRALEKEPGNPMLLCLKGKIEVKQRKFDAAVDTFLNAIEKDKKQMEAYLNIGNCFFILDRYTQCADYTKQYLETNPTDSVACFRVGMALDRVGAKEEAEYYFLEAKKHDLEKSIQTATSYFNQKNEVKGLAVWETFGPEIYKLSIYF